MSLAQNLVYLLDLTHWMVINLKHLYQGRRQFLAGVLATGLAPSLTWADAGSPAFLSAAAKADGTYVLCGISQNLEVVFQIELPSRGHAAVAHPTQPEAVAFARRPGTFALIVDCINGTPKTILTAPGGRHFNGHGVYSLGAEFLFTTENDYDAGRGCVGVWDVKSGYARIDEFDSGGIGPHDIKRLPNSDILVIANGGIDTHPDTGRVKLNIPTMQPNLSYFQDGKFIETVTLKAELHKNSIRHLSVNQTGDVAFGIQIQNNNTISSLVGLHSRGHEIAFLKAPSNEIRRLKGYIGSITFSSDTKSIAATSPRGGVIHIYDTAKQKLRNLTEIPDVCGIVAKDFGYCATAGTGKIINLSDNGAKIEALSTLRWDNHLIAI